MTQPARMAATRRHGLMTAALLTVALTGTACTGVARGSADREGRPGRTGAAWVADGGYVRSFLLDAGGEGGVVLVDAGSETDAATIRGVLAAMGRTVRDVSTILLTHAHLDHVAGVPAFPDATVMALDAEVPLVQGEVEARSPFGRSPLGWFFRVEKGLRVHRALHDGETLTVGALAFRVHALPGHTDGSAAYACGDLLFLGDAAYGRGPDLLEGPKWVFSHDIGQGEAALAALADRIDRQREQPAWLLPAHTPPVAGIAPLKDFARAVKTRRP
ncbi:MAG: MBL fold metallo-hydrolase [Candidatus Sericytochromatia bacterium]|nr:MBL fold metallo-hydrolase [Candidatus Sericytochromatia bacterium]